MKKFVAILLVGLILTSLTFSKGVTLYENFCFTKNQQSFSLNSHSCTQTKAIDCCEKDTESCCAVENQNSTQIKNLCCQCESSSLLIVDSFHSDSEKEILDFYDEAPFVFNEHTILQSFCIQGRSEIPPRRKAFCSKTPFYTLFESYLI